MHVERLLADYDANPVDALTVALRIALDMPGEPWSALLDAAPVDQGRRELLLSLHEPSLDDLAAQLNEFRCFNPG